VPKTPKKDFASFDLHAVIQEIQPKLADSRINNIYQLDPKTLLLKLHQPNQPPIQLILEAGRRLHLTAYSLEKPPTPPAFCMTLRKYLSGAFLTNITQYENERIATLQIKTKEGTHQLILELFGEGNLILTNSKNEILQALHFKRMRDRNILRNQPYQYPPTFAKNPFKITQTDLQTALTQAGPNETVKTIVRFLGTGGTYAEELLLRANIEKTKPSNTLTDTEIDALYQNLQELLTLLQTAKLEPNIILDSNGNFLDVAPFTLKRYQNYKTQPYATFSEALDEFYVRVTTAEKALAGIDVTQLKRESERLQRMTTEQEHALQEDMLKAERDKQIGDTIYAHFNELQTLLQTLTDTWNQKRDLSAAISQVEEAKKLGKIPEVYYESFDPKNLAINLQINQQHFSLTLRKTLYENAAEFYDRGKHNKQKSTSVQTALKDTKTKLADIQHELGKAEALKTAAPAEALEELEQRRIETKEWFEKFRHFTSSEGFLVVAGKDTVSNEVLIKKHTQPYDIVFHAEITGSPFVVVKTEGKEPGNATLKEAGEYAASFSRAWRETVGAADVYWVKPEQLTKSGPSGESIPHGAFFVNGKRNWMRGTPLKTAVGIKLDVEEEFVGGPVDAVKAQTRTYITLVPGDLEGKEFLKTILRSLTLKLPKEQREKMGKTSIESIREFIPYTKGRIVENPA
jgi:predicted ribosome quality control (RQC) complex YloA/Tae2 family protein